jgi:hypothetical protein
MQESRKTIDRQINKSLSGVINLIVEEAEKQCRG